MKAPVFKKQVWDYYRNHKRDFSWRRTQNPYRILVSEIMLQQTQTFRVEPKYLAFIKKFPTLKKLAAASVPELLKAWQGLGYNRRALYLKKTAQTIIQHYRGKFPSDPALLQKLAGIGPNTAGSIAAFAFNKPVVFIETNIRRVFIHFFFPDQQQVGDKEILALVLKTLDVKNPREWYFALMDYGVMLAKRVPNPNRRSKHYSIQSKFFGSDREARGIILRMLLKAPARLNVLAKESGRNKTSVENILLNLAKEGFVKKSGSTWSLVL